MPLSNIYRDLFSNQHFRIEMAVGAAQVDAASFVRIVEACRLLLADRGVGAGDAILFHGDQGLPALAMFWACVMEAAIFVPVDVGWPPYLLAKVVALTKPVLAVVDDELLPVWQAVAANTPLLAVSGLPMALDALTASRPNVARDGVTPEAPAAYLFTSGSSGEPKAVVLSHAALARSARLAVDTFGWQAGERLLNLADPHTMSGLRNAFVVAPLAGMTWVCVPKKERGNTFALLDVVERAQAQRMVSAPVLLRHVNLVGARMPDTVFASMKALYCTGTDLNTDEVRRFHSRFGIPVVNYYGLTETVGLCLAQDVHHWSADDASVGRPVGCKVRIIDDEGREVAQGGVGELQVLLEHPMSGYLHDAEATAAMFDGAWLRTGDLVRSDREGRVFIVGRRGNFIKTLGTDKVQPQEIEAVLEDCPGVAEAAVFGWADPAGGERIAALVVATEGASLADGDLARFVQDRLGAARVPAIFRHVAVIPRSANGKILRKQLGEFI